MRAALTIAALSSALLAAMLWGIYTAARIGAALHHAIQP